MIRLLMLRAACFACIVLFAIGYHNGNTEFLRASAIATWAIVLLLFITLIGVRVREEEEE